MGVGCCICSDKVGDLEVWVISGTTTDGPLFFFEPQFLHPSNGETATAACGFRNFSCVEGFLHCSGCHSHFPKHTHGRCHQSQTLSGSLLAILLPRDRNRTPWTPRLGALSLKLHSSECGSRKKFGGGIFWVWNLPSVVFSLRLGSHRSL